MAKKKKKKLRRGSLKGGKNQPFKTLRGSKFKRCVAKKSHQKGVKNAKKLCGAIYWAKYPKGKGKRRIKGR